MDVNFISLIVAVVLLVVDLFLVGYIKKKGYFLILAGLKTSKLLAIVLIIVLAYTIYINKYVYFIICLTGLRVVDKIVYLLRKDKNMN